jgi:hypothetical protein
VTVTVLDSLGAMVTAQYSIDCPAAP